MFIIRNTSKKYIIGADWFLAYSASAAREIFVRRYGYMISY